jgi:hypothetical protein
MSDNTFGTQDNLVGELISEMQRTNNPAVFNIDNNGNQSGSAQMPIGINQNNNQPINGSTSGGQPQNPAQINPQLQQQFMYVLKQNPQLQQAFGNPQALQQALQNPTIMINAIAQHQQMVEQMQQTQPNLQNLEQIQNSAAQQNSNDDNQNVDEGESEDEDEDEEIDPDQLLHGPIQYEEDLDNVNNKKKYQEDDEMGFIERLIHDLKFPLIATVIYVILTQQPVKEMIIKFVPKIQNSNSLQTLTFAGIFLTLCFITKKILDQM